MSEINLMVFGCGVSFIGLAGFYVYLREAFTSRESEADEASPTPSTRGREAVDAAMDAT